MEYPMIESMEPASNPSFMLNAPLPPLIPSRSGMKMGCVPSGFGAIPNTIGGLPSQQAHIRSLKGLLIRALPKAHRAASAARNPKEGMLHGAGGLASRILPGTVRTSMGYVHPS